MKRAQTNNRDIHKLTYNCKFVMNKKSIIYWEKKCYLMCNWPIRIKHFSAFYIIIFQAFQCNININFNEFLQITCNLWVSTALFFVQRNSQGLLCMKLSRTPYPVTVKQCCKGPSESEANKHSRKHRRHGAEARWPFDKFRNLMIQKWIDITGSDSTTDRWAHQDRDMASTSFCLQLFFSTAIL